MHCSKEHHDCKCFKEILVTGASSTDRTKILNTIVSDNGQTVYGTIYYDIDKDMLFFKNKKGIVFELFSNIRSIFTPSTPIFDYKGEWQSGPKYYKNNIVSINENTELWIAIDDVLDKNIPNNSKNWKLLMKLPEQKQIVINNSVSIWQTNTRYLKNQIILFKEVQYVCLVEHTSYEKNNPANSQFFWRLYESITTVPLKQQEEEITIIIDKPFFYGVFVKESKKYKLDSKKKITKLEDSDIIETSGKADLDLFERVKKELKNGEVKIEFNFIPKNNNTYFDITYDKLCILRKGYYRVSYNLTFSFVSKAECIISQEHYTSHAYVNLIDNEKNTETIYSSKGHGKHIVNGEWSINHNFILPLLDESSELEFFLNTKGIGITEVFIHPVSTWISIELITENLE